MKNINFPQNNNRIMYYLIFSSFYILCYIRIVNSKELNKKLIELCSNSFVVFLLLLIIVVSEYIINTDLELLNFLNLSEKNKIKLKTSCFHALVAFIVAFLGYFDFIIEVFIFIFILTFYVKYDSSKYFYGKLI